MFIQTEETPNPNSLKFIPGKDVLGNEQPIQFYNSQEAEISNLAEMLFKFDFVEAVFLGSDFITVTKKKDFTWNIIKPDLLVTIMEFYVVGKSVMKNNREHQVSNSNSINENDSEIVKQIKELIEIRVRPAVAQDGGDIIFKDFVDGVVKLQLHGACSGCPSSTITLKNGIESMLKHYVPEVIAVEAVNDY